MDQDPMLPEPNGFGGQQGSLVQSVSIPTRKAIQAIEQVEVVFGGQQDSN